MNLNDGFGDLLNFMVPEFQSLNDGLKDLVDSRILRFHIVHYLLIYGETGLCGNINVYFEIVVVL